MKENAIAEVKFMIKKSEMYNEGYLEGFSDGYDRGANDRYQEGLDDGYVIALRNVKVMVDKKLSNDVRDNYEKLFKNDMKKHIDAISSKYIIPGETADQAILFLPAEAIFAEVNAYHSDIINYAYKKHVWITSPTTLISTLTVIQMIIKNMERDKYTSIIHEELNKLGLEFSRYRERWDKLAKSIQTVNKDVENVYITTDKISRKFETINKVDVEKLIENKHKGIE